MKRNSPQHPHQNCIAFFERLSEYIDKELDPLTREHITSHIKACKPCRVCLDTLKRTVNLCNRMERHQVPEAFSLKLKQVIFDLMNTRSD